MTVLLFVPYLPIPIKLFVLTPDPCWCYDATLLDFDIFPLFPSVSRLSQHRETVRSIAPFLSYGVREFLIPYYEFGEAI